MKGSSSVSYFRSMSEREYKIWEGQGSLDVGREWAVKKLWDGFPLGELKEWVDDKRKSHKLVVLVNSSQSGEFDLATVGDRFGADGREGGDYMLPYRYMNRVPIAFERAQIVYDPEAIISDEPLLDLEQMI